MAKSEIKMTMSLATKGATSALNTMGAKIRSFSQKGTEALNRVAKAGIAAMVAGFGLASREALSLGREIENLSRVANSTPAEFQKMAYAAETVGISQEKLADQFKDFDERVGQFLNEGTGELKQFFEEIAPKVGVTAEMFAKLSGPEAMMLYVESLQKAGIEGKQFDEMLERTASDMKVLSPLFANNSELLKQLGKDAQTNGLIMSDATSKALNDMSLKFDRFKKKAVIKVGQILSGENNHAAIKQLGAQFMAMMAKVGVWLGNAFLGASRTLAAALIASVETLWPRLKTGFQMLGLVIKQAVAPAINDLVDMLNNIPGIELPKMDVSEVEQQLTDLGNAPKKGFAESFEKALEGMNNVNFEADKAVGFWQGMANEQGEILKGAQGTAEATKQTATNVSNIEGRYKSIKELELDLQMAKANGDRQEQGAIQDQIELETLVADLRKRGVKSREEALAIAEKILFNQKEMERAEEALMDAHIEGNDALIHEEQKRLDMLKSIDEVMTSTGKNYHDALETAEKLAAIRFGPDVNQSGFTTRAEQREFDRRQKERAKVQKGREKAEIREEGLLGNKIRNVSKEKRKTDSVWDKAAASSEDKARRADLAEAQRRVKRGEDAGDVMADINQRRADRLKPKGQKLGPDGKPVDANGNHMGPGGVMVGPNGAPLGPGGKPQPGAAPKEPKKPEQVIADKLGGKLDEQITLLGDIKAALKC